MYLFFITDGMELLHTNIPCEETCEHLSVVLGGCSITCELEVGGEEYDIELGHSCVSEPVAQELFRGCDVEVDPCIVHGRIWSSDKGYRSLDLFIQKEDVKKLSQAVLCCRLKEEMMNPLRLIITNPSPDTELVVVDHVELSVYEVGVCMEDLVQACVA
ncbi:unnamed protein product [Lactuca virosa]|uniref:Uncharacterized protein n=1 Tax=Lactuca virosa TaxID=75947 RepID=A0AAU9MY52_9ASTR|nr:unnamed protein product [Lactuca virosa]